MATLVEITTPATIALKLTSTTTWTLLLLEPKDTRGFWTHKCKSRICEKWDRTTKKNCIKIFQTILKVSLQKTSSQHTLSTKCVLEELGNTWVGNKKEK